MMKKLLIVPLFFFCVAVTAQMDDPSRFASIISIENLKKHLTVIAGEEMQGRETGTEGERKAAKYIESQFKALGLTTAPGLNGYQQYFPLYKDSLKESELEINNKEAVYGSDYISPANNNETKKIKSKKLVFAGYGIEDKNYNDYSSLNVKDKVVVIFLGEPKANGVYLISGTSSSSEWTFPGLSKKLDLAASKGAVGVLVINPAQLTFQQRVIDNSKKTNVFYPRSSTGKTLNYALVSHAYAKNILGTNTDSLLSKARSGRSFSKNDLFEKNIKIQLEIEKVRLTINSSNVLGVIEGTDKKEEYVFLTAHYDHLGMRDGKIFYGADDDGSGTAAVINIAEAFSNAKKEGKGPRRTIVFMTVSGEEKGLLGSEYYSDNPVYPLEKTSVDLNIDMVGRIDTEKKSGDTMNYVYVVGHDKLSSDLPVINEGVNNKYTKLELDYKFDDPKDPNRIYFRSDHYNFARKGVPILFFYDGMLQADYHKTSDTIDKITWPLYEKRVRMIFHTAWEIANRDDMLKRDVPLNMGTR